MSAEPPPTAKPPPRYPLPPPDPARTTIFHADSRWADGIEVLVIFDDSGRAIRAFARRPTK